MVSGDAAPTLDQLIDHAVHIAGLVGAGHVGLVLDFADEDVRTNDWMPPFLR